jgi:hypothetical protein
VTLEQAIHERWAASQALAALLPADRVTTGRSSRGAVPYVTLLRERSRTALRTNAGDTLEEVTLRMNVWHEDYDAARAIVDQIRVAFDCSHFELAGGSRVLRMRRTGDWALQHGDGLWQLTIRFLVQIGLESGT